MTSIRRRSAVMPEPEMANASNMPITAPARSRSSSIEMREAMTDSSDW